MSERTVRKRRRRWPASLWITALVATLAMPVLGAPDVVSAQTVSSDWAGESPSSSPPARYVAGEATDVTRGEVVVFGGINSDGRLGDTWVWGGSNWSRRSTTGPAARWGAAMAPNPGGGVVLFGGSTSTDFFNDETWVWNGTTATWTKQNPITSPPGRQYGAMAYDPARNEVVLFGGRDANGMRGDTWVWNGINWTRRTPSGDRPPARYVAATAYDPARAETVLFGGSDGSTALGDTWAWNGLTWAKQCDPCGISARSGAWGAMDFDPTRREVVVFGGGEISDDTWAWDGDDWTERNPVTRPPARMRSSLALHPPSGELVLFGGYDGTNYRDDTWTLQAEVETPDPGELLDEVPDPEDLIEEPGFRYPSDDCDGGTNVVSGFFGGKYAKVRTAPHPTEAGTTMVCVAADDRDDHHLGGRVDVRAGLPGAPVATDDKAEACQAEDGNVTLLSGTVAGGQPVRLDVATVPGDDGDLVWVCTQLTDAVGARLVFSAADATGPGFDPDITEPHPFYTEEPWPVVGQPSAACDAVGQNGQENQRENHLVNARVGTTFLGLYHAQPGGDSDSHWVCYRAQTSPTEGEGGRITADATPSVGTDATGCTWDVVTTGSPISAGLFLNWDPTQDPPPDSAKVCVTTNDVVFTTVTAETAVPGFEQDTA